jgi:hypothetical protein
MLCLATVESILFSLNQNICKSLISASDHGGAMTIHVFGAIFGLLASFGFNKTELNREIIYSEYKKEAKANT